MAMSTRSLLVAALLSAVACGGSSTGPSSPSLTGTWSGVVHDATWGDGSATATIVQSGSSVSGSWSTQYPTIGQSVIGQISGSIDSGTTNPTLLATLLSADGCSYLLSAQYGSESLGGSYSGTCGHQGTFTLFRQSGGG
jgi:hypothetical protein